jgi:hypothetical protein
MALKTCRPHSMIWPPFLYLAAALLAAASTLASAQDLDGSYAIVPPPSWVVEAQSPGPAAMTADAQAWLLLDYQTNVATEEMYTRVVRELRSAGGVAVGSNLSAGYNPSYQKLLLHHLRVIRNGAASSRLSRQAVHLLRRELSLDSQVLDGSLTASLVIEDVRPGDRIDFAFTVRGRNPALGGHFSNAFNCGWTMPVARQRIRILCPSGRPLHYRLHGASAEPVRGLSSGLTEYAWEFADTPPASPEDRTPSWHIGVPWLQVSDFQDWADVRRWATALYPPAQLPPELEQLVASWRDSKDAPLLKAQAALDWVQRNIRYVGIELGAGSLSPSPPATVAQRRFGDCKDQSYLLCALLRRLGLQADPVLVSTWARRLVAEMLPSDFAFNHVVTRIRSGRGTYFVDPANSFQRGPIRDRYMPDYGHGLILSDEQTGLTAFRAHQGVAPEMEVAMRFTATEWEQPALLEVQSVYRGGAADRVRAFASTSRTEVLAAGYLNYYAARYPGIQSAGDIRLDDDPAADIFRTSERYSLPGFWQAQGRPEGHSAEVFADAVIDAIPNPSTKVRLAPLAVDFPQHIVQRIEIELPDPWAGKPSSRRFANAAFELSIRQTHSGRKVTLSYDYRTRAEAVPAREFAAYQHSILELEPELGFEVWTEKRSAAARPNAVSPIPLAVGLAGFVLLSAGALFAHRRVVRQGRSLPPQEPVPGQPQGLGGWLILVAIGLFAHPLFSIVGIGRLAPMLTVSAWQQFAQPAGSNYHALGGAFIVFELLANLAIGIASILLLAWFFQRRRAFPRTFIYLLIVQVLLALAEPALAKGIVGAKTEGLSPPQAIGLAVSSGAWILYMIRSTRVQLTFTR